MKLHIKVSYLKSFKHVPAVASLLRYQNEEQFVDIYADKFTPEQLNTLYDLAKSSGGEQGARGLMMRITAFRNVRANPSGQKITKLEPLVEALCGYIGPSPNKWLFHTEDDGYAVPYFVSDIHYSRPEPRTGSPATVQMKLSAVTRGSKDGKTIVFHQTDLGATVVEILNEEGYYLETEEAVASYWRDVEQYKAWASLTGKQFLCAGIAFPLNRWEYSNLSMEREGQPAKVVMDDASEDGEERRGRERGNALASTVFWIKRGAGSGDDDEDESGTEEGSVAMPVHPYVKVFDLEKHQFVLAHVGNLAPYVYDKTVIQKLVLDQESKDLVALLVSDAGEVMEDIIAGKTGGTVVILTGPPGTGKTLTAEVMSEEIERPLYVVQCSQLGTDEEAIEKELGIVLARASRWGALLLIDEADVYIRMRGEDIRQNAIVGVFLRVLERYRGVLFMTSNRATIIDDAILSRATAWLRYSMPSSVERAAIWKILSEQYRILLSKELVHSLSIEFNCASGRNIKSLLKLAGKLLRRREEPADMPLFKYVARFLDVANEKV